jgi:pimeloyl-ACP methyl ester carboxylesterase
MKPSSANSPVAESNESAAVTVVLVHGAWADASSWSEVIASLQAQDLDVVSVQNPLHSLQGDVDAVRRALENSAAPVLLVGHSWGGVVITQAGSHPKVAGLVYVTAFAPDVGQSVNDLQSGLPPPAYAPHLRPDSGGYLWLAQEAFPDCFAQDLPPVQSRVLAAAQNPVHASVFDARVTGAAWAHKPNWFLRTENDRMIDPTLQQSMATRIQATTRSVASSHVPFLSHPKETSALILDAVDQVQKLRSRNDPGA